MNNRFKHKRLSIIGIIFLISICSKSIFAQCTSTCGSNLLPNPGFEFSTAQCANPDNQVYSNLTPVDAWFGVEAYDPNSAAGSTPDYFSPCGSNPGTTNIGCQTADAMVGIFTRASFASGRESLQAQLLAPLVAGKTYCFSMVVKSRVGAAGNLLSQCDGIGAWFHNQGWIDIDAMNGGNQFIGPGSTINAQPQIENPSGNLIGSSCVTVMGTFCATGGEEWIVISNFRDDANTIISGPNPTNYMYIDEVKLFEVCDTLELELSSPDLAISCGGTTQLIPQLSTNLSPITYSWLPSGLGLSGGGNQTVSPNTSTNYTLIASAINACGQTISDTAQIQISVDACGLFFDLNDTAICEGACLTLQNPIAINGTPPYQYYWSGGYSSGDVLCPTISTYLICTVVDSVGNSFSDTMNLVVNPIPLLLLPADTSICENNVLTIHAIHDGSILWSTNSTSDSIQIQPSVGTWYSAISTWNGCSRKDSIYVNINQNPQFILNATNISCYGEMNGSILISGLISNGVSHIEWSNGIMNQNMISQLQANLYWAELIDSNGCVHRDSAQVIEPAEIIAGIVGPDTVCAGSHVDLTVIATGGNPSYNYVWSNGDTSMDIHYQLQASQNISVIVSDQSSCSDTVNIALIAIPSAEAAFEGSDSTCYQSTVQFINSSLNASNYLWEFSNGVNTNTTNATVSFNLAGCYDARLIAINAFGCNDTLEKTCVVNIYPSPQADLFTTNEIVTELNPMVTFINNSSGSDSCLFSAGNGFIVYDCASTYQINYEDIGVYHAMLYIWNEYGCMDSSVATTEVIATPTLFVPNAFSPNGDGINDTFYPQGNGIDAMELFIFNRWGELIFSSDNENKAWDGAECPIDVYVWKINYKDRNGKYHEEYGHVSIVK